MSLLVVSAKDVAKIAATFEPQELTDLMAQVFHSLSKAEKSPGEASGIHQPHRISVPVTNHTGLFMPSRIEPFGTAIKVVSVPTSTAPPLVKEAGLPGTTLVLDETSGAVKAVVNARQLTALRNAAGSLLATRLLSIPDAKPRKLVAFGAGAQIAAHISLFLKHFSTITSCTIFNRSINTRLSTLASRLKAEAGSVNIDVSSLPKDTQDDAFRAAVREADLIITATSSTTPFFPSDYVKPGAHLCLIGSYTPKMYVQCHEMSSLHHSSTLNLVDRHEVDTDLVKRAGRVVVDSRAACLVEAGELITAGLRPFDLVEIGELLQPAVSADGSGSVWAAQDELVRKVQAAGDVTIFKSVGVGVQDVAIASAVARKAAQESIGTIVADYDELS
ncbi:NAD(P)-binding protein [Rhodofomes roseus]|uniref:NAD(P)-binding protein n=1 Tax=Rhodofomes roseus TaxID=34475 RepID=A0ABQ8KR06_9APHY|nr:NAD(P)-binding protein [Rhodofomes roseus]KAH9840822.1 NAD(P)-binding protein [Rhodofomes roseus]